MFILKKLLFIFELVGFLVIKIIKAILYLCELIGLLTVILFQILFKLTLKYFSAIGKTFARLFYFIQFIGETTLLVFFIIGTFLRASTLYIYYFIHPLSPKTQHKVIRSKKSKKKTPFVISFKPDFRFLFRPLSPPPAYAVVTTFTILLLCGTYYVLFLKNLPSPYDLLNKPLPRSSKVVDKNGNLLFITYNGKINRIPIPFLEIPDHVKKSTIAIEDQNFYQHKGISVKGILRAFINNLNHKPTQGGSTITQQLVKIALLKDDRRIVSRKIKEAYLSLLIEKVYSKDQILEMYLNNAPYGGTAYGIEAAARKYFGKEASKLSLSESSLLASLPTAPTLYSPYSTDQKIYKGNQERVLNNMIELGFINNEEKDKAVNEKLAFYSIENQILAPHFVFWVLDNLEKEYGKDIIQEGGLTIKTTLDLPTQLKAQQIVKENVEKLEKPYWISNAAALITQPKSGAILAMVGSRDYFDDEHEGKVNLPISPRQPGSSIKPVNYAYALASGKFTPSSIIQDTPVTYRNPWETYTPQNYDGKYRGAVTVKQALAMSLNIPAVKVLDTYGPDKMRELGIRMGIDSWKYLKNYGLSLTLGAGEVKMTELATVYGTISNLGKRKDLYAVSEIEKPDGTSLANKNPDNEKGILGVSKVYASEEQNIIPEYTAYQLTNILSDNQARMPAFGPYAKLEIPGHKVAVKTGTTNNIRDNWTIGYNPEYLVATWVGNFDNKIMNPNLTSGITGAAPIWNEIMNSLLEGKPEVQYATPSGMVKLKVCATNGLLTCARCPKEVDEYFKPGTEPKTACYFPSPEECSAKKSQMEGEGKSADEISKALVNCPSGTGN